MHFLHTICFAMIFMQLSEATDLITAIENDQFEGANLKEGSPKLQELKNLIAIADINAEDEYENTALEYAAERENAELVRILTESGADTNLRANDGENVLHITLRKWGDALVHKWENKIVSGDEERSANAKLMCEHLLKAGADRCQRDGRIISYVENCGRELQSGRCGIFIAQRSRSLQIL